MIPTQQLNDFQHQFFQWKGTILNQSPNQEHPRLQLNRPRLEWYKPNPKKHEWRDTWMNFKQVKCNLWYTLNEIKQFHYMKCFIQKPNPTLVWYTTFQVETRANAWLISSNPIENGPLLRDVKSGKRKPRPTRLKWTCLAFETMCLAHYLTKILSHLSIKCESRKWLV